MLSSCKTYFLIDKILYYFRTINYKFNRQLNVVHASEHVGIKKSTLASKPWAHFTLSSKYGYQHPHK